MGKNDQNRYFNKRDADNAAKYNELKKSLPGYVDDFLLIEKFSWSTRVAYAYDLIDFFGFLINTYPEYPRETNEITTALLNTIDSEGITKYQKKIRTQTSKSTTYNNKLSAVRSLFRFLYTKDLVDSEISRKISLDRISEADKPRIVALDPEEVTDLLHIIQYESPFSKKKQPIKDKYRSRDLAITAILLYTGIRVSECVGINIEDIDLKNSCIKEIHRKGGKNDVVYFKDKCADFIRPYLEERRTMLHDIAPESIHALFLIELSDGTWDRISVKAIERMVRDYNMVSNTTKHITPHKFRSTYATNLGKQGDLQMLKECLGHTNIQMSQRYADFDQRKKIESRNSIEY